MSDITTKFILLLIAIHQLPKLISANNFIEDAYEIILFESYNFIHVI